MEVCFLGAGVERIVRNMKNIQGAHAGLTKSYNCFSIYKALQSLILGIFSPKRSYKVLFLKGKKIVSELEMLFLPWSKIT